MTICLLDHNDVLLPISCQTIAEQLLTVSTVSITIPAIIASISGPGIAGNIIIGIVVFVLRGRLTIPTTSLGGRLCPLR